MAQLSTKLPWELAQTKWASTINPILALPILQGNLITAISLIAGTPKSINHLLGRMPQGWFLVDNTSNAVIWRSSDFTQYTVTLETSVTTTVSIWIF
jgi:Tfp pilus assembly protein PilN